ncbi:Neutral and basic amino acid transport protein rBAT [Papilio xuthus]|uniref:Neutral and basic amino acid transport protein rBAT n=1 Tax=Papilio xuthus TaxID=66420 RepID=A0A194PHF4_PAPXU|nr:Neutral and basic amino acid transport protein rBAT [Papilio xuthus]
MNDLPETSCSNEATDLETIDYLRGVKSSTCLLLPMTPSPTPLDFKHPLSEEMNEGQFLNIAEDSKITNAMQNSDASAGDSSSSGDSNSVVQDPVSAQLINNISMLDYQTLSKNGDLIVGQPEGCKINGNLNVNNRKLPNFVNWNWVIIRKILLWVVISGLVACLGAIIAMVITIPKSCDPDLPWHQGKVFYEVFPASFKDSNDDGFGDLKGLIKKLDYIKDLGCNTVRLNYIFEAQDYPENYNHTTYLLKVDRSLGVLKDFQDLVKAIHDKEMYIILDIPVLSMVASIETKNSNHTSLLTNDTSVGFSDMSAAIKFWSQAQNVDGFYLKNLENFVEDVNFAKSLQIWKHIIGGGKILIASEKALELTKGDHLTVFLNRIDLIDVHLDLNEGVKGLKNHIDKVVFGTLRAKAHYPWILWNVGNVNSERVSSRFSNNTLALTALEMSLPGTISLFYGDEIGLKGLSKNEAEKDFHEYNKIHNLVSMSFTGNNESASILPWNSKPISGPRYHYLNIIKKFIEIRLKTPTIYLRAIFKDGSAARNMKIRITEENLIIIERWFPRRNSCVFIGNFGGKSISTDLSSMFYSGAIMASTNDSSIGEVLYFENVTFSPNSAMILKLEK